MLKDKPNIRSDFHESLSSTGSITYEDKLLRWLKVFFIFGLGFILGMVYAKSVSHFQNETLAMSTVNEQNIQDSGHEVVLVKPGRTSSKA